MAKTTKGILPRKTLTKNVAAFLIYFLNYTTNLLPAEKQKTTPGWNFVFFNCNKYRKALNLAKIFYTSKFFTLFACV